MTAVRKNEYEIPLCSATVTDPTNIDFLPGIQHREELVYTAESGLNKVRGGEKGCAVQKTLLDFKSFTHFVSYHVYLLKYILISQWILFYHL